MTWRNRTRPQFSPDAQASAREVVKSAPLTCQGCAHLRTYPRPICKGEASPHYRMARETYHARCPAFGVRAAQ